MRIIKRNKYIEPKATTVEIEIGLLLCGSKTEKYSDPEVEGNDEGSVANPYWNVL